MSVSASTVETEAFRRERFELDGYVVVRKLIPRSEAEELAAQVRAIIAGEPCEGVADCQVQRQYGRRGRLKMVKVSQLTQTTRHFRELAHRDAVVDIVEELIGPRASLFRDVVVVKPAHAGGRLSLHQDSAYWDIVPMALVSAWVALTDVPVEASCLELVPGSHHAPVPHGLVLRDRVKVPGRVSCALRALLSRAGTGDNPGGAGGNLPLWKAKSLVLSTATRWLPVMGDLQDYRVMPGHSNGAAVARHALEAGDAVFFHSLLVHGSGPNAADHDRLADIISYAPAGATFVGRGAADLALARSSRT